MLEQRPCSLQARRLFLKVQTMACVDPLRDKLVQEVTRFRRAMESAQFGKEDGSLGSFPRECCHHACNLLGIYLMEMGYGKSTKVTGCRGNVQAQYHVWLVHQGFILDISADQFSGEGRPSVIVATFSVWHETWRLVKEQAVDEAYCERIRAGWYEDRYQKVQRLLNASALPS
jgi:hypothetical protein